MLAEVAKTQVGEHLVDEDGVGRLREQDLPAVRSRADPAGPMHPQADVSLGRERGLAGVHSHPHPKIDPLRP